jgi:hypothetical protein
VASIYLCTRKDITLNADQRKMKTYTEYENN